MTQATNPFSARTLLRAAALSLVMGTGAATFTPLAPVAVADVTAADVKGTFVAENNPDIVNEFVMDIFGGLEITPIRDGRRGRTVIYEKVRDGLWREAGLFKSNRATYEYTNSGAFVWKRGDREITLWRTGRQSETTETSNYTINGSLMLDGNRRNYNVFDMVSGDKIRITPYRNGQRRAVVEYVRVDADTFKDTRGSGTYTALPNGNLLWESNDNRNIRISLTPR